VDSAKIAAAQAAEGAKAHCGERITEGVISARLVCQSQFAYTT
jgi:hypothetical protein